MSDTELSIAMVFAALCVLGAVWWVVKITEEPDPMDDEHGDEPHMPEVRHD